MEFNFAIGDCMYRAKIYAKFRVTAFQIAKQQIFKYFLVSIYCQSL